MRAGRRLRRRASQRLSPLPITTMVSTSGAAQISFSGMPPQSPRCEAARGAGLRRASGEATDTGGKVCAPVCDDDPACAKEICGNNTTADAVANAADRNIPRQFN